MSLLSRFRKAPPPSAPVKQPEPAAPKAAPEPAPNPEYKNYCCYPPAPLPERGSCVSHTEVPDCKSGRFGFACYGPDRPEDSYLPMRCPESGSAGLSAEGYPATLYCCDFQ